MTSQMAGVQAVLNRTRLTQAAAVGMAVGAGLAARYLAERGTRTRTAGDGVVDWATAHAIAAPR